MRILRSVLTVALAATLIAAAPATTYAAPEAAEADSEGDLAKKLQNPIAALISVPFQNNFEWGQGTHSDGFKYTLNFQPVIPISISENYNLISRTIVPVIHQEDIVPHSTQDGMGDITQSLFFSPKSPGSTGIIYGAGPVFLIPTGTEQFLGTEKFGIGPTAVMLRQSHGWTYGFLANHICSVAGTKHTPDVNATFLQPFASYTTKTHTTFGMNTESTYDWVGSKWTIPINPFVSQILKIGPLPISLQLGPKIYVEGPTTAADWGLRFAVVLLFPTH